jgi:hypothetical protein
MPTPQDTPQTYPNFTNHGLGEGILDQLMIAVEYHVNKQFDEGRIDSASYGQVYLGALEAAMTQATQFLLGQLLIDEKRRGQDLNNQKTEFEIEFMLPKQLELITAQIAKIDAEISLLGKQEDKIDKEIEFLTYKILTERANTEAGIADDASLIGKQMTLLTAQRLGFAGDIQVKVGKLFADYDAVYQSTQEHVWETLNEDNTQSKLQVAEQLATAIQTLEGEVPLVPLP